MWNIPRNNIEEYIKFYFCRYRGEPKTCSVEELINSFSYDCAKEKQFEDFSEKQLEEQFMAVLHKMAKTEELSIDGSEVTGDYIWPPERRNWKPNIGDIQCQNEEKRKIS